MVRRLGRLRSGRGGPCQMSIESVFAWVLIAVAVLAVLAVIEEFL